MERFERKDLELPFNELAQLKQVGTLEAYILEFEKISVMVSYVSMRRLVLLFTEDLDEPLKGLVKSHKPTTLKDAMILTIDLQDVLPRTRFPPKPNSEFEKKDWTKDAPDKKSWKIYSSKIIRNKD